MGVDLRPYWRELGCTGVVVSPLGLGTVKLGRDRGVKYPTPVRIPDDDEVIALLAHAHELGINLIDTAPAYGNAEERLGKLMGKAPAEWVICTKVGEEFTHGESSFDFSPGAIRDSVERSLARLRVEALDVVLIHSDGVVELHPEFDDALGELRSLRERGLIRAFGASVKFEEGARRTIERAQVVMVTLNPGEPDAGEWIKDAEVRAGVLVKKPLASGHLDRLGENPLEASMRFIFGHPSVTAAIVGTTSLEHLDANVRAVAACKPTHRMTRGEAASLLDQLAALVPGDPLDPEAPFGGLREPATLIGGALTLKLGSLALPHTLGMTKSGPGFKEITDELSASTIERRPQDYAGLFEEFCYHGFWGPASFDICAQSSNGFAVGALGGIAVVLQKHFRDCLPTTGCLDFYCCLYTHAWANEGLDAKLVEPMSKALLGVTRRRLALACPSDSILLLVTLARVLACSDEGLGLYGRAVELLSSFTMESLRETAPGLRAESWQQLARLCPDWKPRGFSRGA